MFYIIKVYLRLFSLACLVKLTWAEVAEMGLGSWGSSGGSFRISPVELEILQVFGIKDLLSAFMA